VSIVFTQSIRTKLASSKPISWSEIWSGRFTFTTAASIQQAHATSTRWSTTRTTIGRSR